MTEYHDVIRRDLSDIPKAWCASLTLHSQPVQYALCLLQFPLAWQGPHPALSFGIKEITHSAKWHINNGFAHGIKWCINNGVAHGIKWCLVDWIYQDIGIQSIKKDVYKGFTIVRELWCIPRMICRWSPTIPALSSPDVRLFSFGSTFPSWPRRLLLFIEYREMILVRGIGPCSHRLAVQQLWQQIQPNDHLQVNSWLVKEEPPVWSLRGFKSDS
jgi:hypothetical protein